MQVRTSVFATLLVLSCALTVVAQGSVQCSLKPAHAPELRGVRLEMTVSQLKARYPKLPVGMADDLGQLKVNLSSDHLAEADPTAFKGVDNLSLYFIDNRLVTFVVTYPYLPWKNIHQFAARMGEALKLPDGWGGDDNAQTLGCDGFQVQAGRASFGDNGMSTYISFKEPGAESIIRERIEKQKEQQLQSFKP